MQAQAIARHQRVGPRKARMVLNLVRGMSAAKAVDTLRFTNKSAAPVVKKLIESALANAMERNPQVDLDSFYIETAFADQAPDQHMRRWRPRAMGRATQIKKGMSHITIVVSNEKRA